MKKRILSSLAFATVFCAISFAALVLPLLGNSELPLWGHLLMLFALFLVLFLGNVFLAPLTEEEKKFLEIDEQQDQ